MGQQEQSVSNEEYEWKITDKEFDRLAQRLDRELEKQVQHVSKNQTWFNILYRNKKDRIQDLQFFPKSLVNAKFRKLLRSRPTLEQAVTSTAFVLFGTKCFRRYFIQIGDELMPDRTPHPDSLVFIDLWEYLLGKSINSPDSARSAIQSFNDSLKDLFKESTTGKEKISSPSKTNKDTNSDKLQLIDSLKHPHCSPLPKKNASPLQHHSPVPKRKISSSDIISEPSPKRVSSDESTFESFESQSIISIDSNETIYKSFFCSSRLLLMKLRAYFLIHENDIKRDPKLSVACVKELTYFPDDILNQLMGQILNGTSEIAQLVSLTARVFWSEDELKAKPVPQSIKVPSNECSLIDGYELFHMFWTIVNTWKDPLNLQPFDKAIDEFNKQFRESNT